MWGAEGAKCIASWSHQNCHRSSIANSKKAITMIWPLDASVWFWRFVNKQSPKTINTYGIRATHPRLSDSGKKPPKSAFGEHTREQTVEIYESEGNKCLPYGRSHSHIAQRASLIRVKGWETTYIRMVTIFNVYMRANDRPDCIYTNGSGQKKRRRNEMTKNSRRSANVAQTHT